VSLRKVFGEIQPELVPPPSQEQYRNFEFYERIQAEHVKEVVEDNKSVLSITGSESRQHLTAKKVLAAYIVQRWRVGCPKSFMGVRSSERKADGIRPLLTGQDFCLDVEIAARKAFRRRPTMRKLLLVLFTREYSARVDAFAAIAPRTFSLFLTLLGAELRRRRITGLTNYLEFQR
jgi:hypothetical protein